MQRKRSSLNDEYRHAELVFGLVAPVGTDYAQVAENLTSQLTEFNYKANVIRLSDQIAVLSQLMGVPCELRDSPEI